MQNCFLMPSRLKSHIILVMDRLQCVARVNCLVLIKEGSDSDQSHRDEMTVVSGCDSNRLTWVAWMTVESWRRCSGYCWYHWCPLTTPNVASTSHQRESRSRLGDHWRRGWKSRDSSHPVQTSCAAKQHIVLSQTSRSKVERYIHNALLS